MARIVKKHMLYITCNGKSFTSGNSVKVTLKDGTYYTGVIQNIFIQTFDLGTEELGSIVLFVEDIYDIESI